MIMSLAAKTLRGAFTFSRDPNQRPIFQYLTRAERFRRTLLAILFFYVFLNGTSYSLCGGFRESARFILNNATGFWMAVGFLVLAALALGLGAFMERRWQLARTQTNMRILTAMTLALAIMIGVAVAVIGRANLWGIYEYWIAFQWLWQVPAGYFVGTGLSWSIRDRQLSGVVAVDQRPVNDEHDPNSAHVADHRLP